MQHRQSFNKLAQIFRQGRSGKSCQVSTGEPAVSLTFPAESGATKSCKEGACEFVAEVALTSHPSTSRTCDIAFQGHASTSKICDVAFQGDASTESAALQASIDELQNWLRQELELKVSALRLQLAADLAADLDSRVATAVAQEHTKDTNSDKPSEDTTAFELRAELEELSQHLQEAVTRLDVLELRRELEHRAQRGHLATVASLPLGPSPPTRRHTAQGQRGFKEQVRKGSVPSPGTGFHESSYPKSGRTPTRIDSWVQNARDRSKNVGHIHVQHSATHTLVPLSFEALEPPLEPLRCADDESEPDGIRPQQLTKPSGAGEARDGDDTVLASHVWQRDFGAGADTLKALEVVQKPEVLPENLGQLPPAPCLRHSFIGACKSPAPNSGRLRVTEAGSLVVGVDV